jgi:hypothetical protein
VKTRFLSDRDLDELHHHSAEYDTILDHLFRGYRPLEAWQATASFQDIVSESKHLKYMLEEPSLNEFMTLVNVSICVSGFHGGCIKHSGSTT